MPMGDMDFSINWMAVFGILSLFAGIPVVAPAIVGAIASFLLKRQTILSSALTGAGIGFIGLVANIAWGIIAIGAGATDLFLAAGSATVLVCIVATCFVVARKHGVEGGVQSGFRSFHG